MAKKKAAVFAPGDHGTTFGGNPLCCAVGYATVKYMIDHDVPGNARKMGQYLMSGLENLKKKYGFIAEVRGRGLLVAMELKKDIAESVLYACLARGLLINQLKPNTIRFIPPLIITIHEVDQAVSILDEALSSLTAK